MAEAAKALPNDMAALAETANERPLTNGSVGISGRNGQLAATTEKVQEKSPQKTVSVPDSTATPSPRPPSPTPWPSTPTPEPAVEREPKEQESETTPTPAPEPEATPEPAGEPVVVPVSTTVVINEIAWMGTDAAATDEWIELYNYGDSDISLDGWKLFAADGSPEIALSGSIVAHGYYLIERSEDDLATDIPYNMYFTGALSNEGEVLLLLDSAGNNVDTAGSGAWYAGSNSPKASMERIDSRGSGTDDSNWAENDGSVMVGSDAADNPIHGTPGYSNSVTPIVTP